MTTLDFTVLWRDRGAERGMRQLGDTTEKTSHRFRGLKIAGAAALAAVGVAAVKFGSQSVKAYVEAEGSQIRLQEAFRKFPKLADTNIGSLNKLNSALAMKTRFDDDATASGQSVLAQFKLTGKQITQLTPLMQDYAAKTGKDLPSAAKVLGKAMMGNARALKEVGINLPPVADATKVLGQAQKNVATTTDNLQKAQQRLADLQAIQSGKSKLTISDQIALRRAQDNVREATEKHNGAVKDLTVAEDGAKKGGDQYEKVMKGLRKQVGGFAEKEGKSAAGQAEILKNQFGELQESAGKQLLPALLKLGEGALRLVGFVGDLGPVFGSFKKIAGAALGTIAEAFGAGKVSFKSFSDFILTHQADITQGFVTGGKFVLKYADLFVTLASTGLRAFAALMDAQANLAAVSLSQFGKILQGASMAFGWIPGIGPRLKDASSKFDAFAGSAVNGMRKTADGARTVADGIDNKLRPALDKAGRKMDEVGRKEILKAEQRDAVWKTNSAFKALSETVDTFGGRSKLTANEQRKLSNRLLDAEHALKDQLGAMRDAGAGQDKLSAAWKRGKDRLYDEFRQMGLSKREAKELARQYAGVKPKVETKFTTPGLPGAQRETKEYDKIINSLNDKNIAIRVRYQSSGSISVGRSRGAGSTLGGNTRAGATGGVLPGWSPGRDIHEFTSPSGGRLLLSGGEAVMRPEWTRAVGGPAAVERMNAAARSGKLHGPTQALAGGGIVVTARTATNNPSNVRGAYSSALNDAEDRAAASARSYARDLARAEIARQKRAARRAAASLGGGGGHKMSGSIVSIARSFHPSYIAGHRDPQGGPAYDIGSSGAKNNAIANALRVNHGRLGLRYVISQMRIASARSGWGWRRYSPITGSGDFRHVGHVHVSYDKGGMLQPGGIGVNRSGQPERVLSPRQTSSFDRMVRVMDRSGHAGGTTIIINAPNYIGSQDDLKRALVDLNRRGQLQVVKR